MDRMKSSSEGGKSLTLRNLGRKILHRKVESTKSSLPALGKQITSTELLTSIPPPTTSTTIITPHEPQYIPNSELYLPQYTNTLGTVYLYVDTARGAVRRSSHQAIPTPPRRPLPISLSGSLPSNSNLDLLGTSLDPEWIDVEMIGRWLRKCDKEHGHKCRRPFGLDPSDLGRPKLLIDVQNKCLVTCQASYRYACLSYVWGGASTLKTKGHNFDSLMLDGSLDIHRDEIPRTIKDAMSFTEQLGIRYIWVDSLCIVQDDEVSKHDQIQAMAGIYANAYVTLIAGNGWDADHGLRGIQGVTEPRHLSSFLKSDFRENLQPYTSIWYSRGWTFQEMVFSPRKIMFQYQLAVWECNQAIWNESSLTSMSTVLDSTEVSISPWTSQIQFSPWPDISQYVSLVHDYTTRKLTYGEDGLHAISSLLSVMSCSFRGGFISGLPEMFFNEALLWQPSEPMQRRVSSVGASNPPSWSWASWEGALIKEEWLEHWSHLCLYRSGPARDTIFQVVPAVKWYFGGTLSERVPINIWSQTYFDSPPSLLPEDWSWINPDRYRYKERAETTSTYPLPVSFSPLAQPASPRFLFCRTRKAVFKSAHIGLAPATQWGSRNLATALQDGNGKRVGALNLNLDGTTMEEPAEGTEFELVIISAGSMISFWPDFDILKWGDFASLSRFNPTELPKNPTIGRFYYVMWIGWEDGIAYRKGLGRVLEAAWDSKETEEIDLVLG